VADFPIAVVLVAEVVADDQIGEESLSGHPYSVVPTAVVVVLDVAAFADPKIAGQVLAVSVLLLP